MYDTTTGKWLTEDPIAFLGGDANLYRYVGNGPTNATDPTGLYEKDVHYYLTYYLAYAVGIPDKDAREIAWVAQFTDVHKLTEPVQGFGGASIEVRRKYHFRTSGDAVKAGSEEAAEIVDGAIKSARPRLLNKVEMWELNYLMGIGLHAYQDSWSHAGFGPRIGHAVQGSKPDWPYTDPQKAMRMAKAVYEKLKAYREKHFPDHKQVKAFNEINVILEKLLETEGTEEQRSANWRRRIERDFKQKVLFSYDPRLDAQAPRVDRFVEVAGGVKPPVKPKGP